MPAYNLFRRKGEETLYCAVPEDTSVPSFLTGEAWEWTETRSHDALSDFDAAAAEASVLANGFYLFHSARAAADLPRSEP